MQELRLLVAAAQESTAQRIRQELNGLSFRVCHVTSAQEAVNAMSNESYAGLMIFLPLPGDGIRLAMEAAQGEICSLFLVGKEDALSMEEREKMRRLGVAFLPKPLSREQLTFALESTVCTYQRMGILRDRQAMLQKKMQELHSVERAKTLLMKTLGMTEGQAHRFIEKQAMDHQQTKAEVAMRIWKTYENI